MYYYLYVFVTLCVYLFPRPDDVKPPSKDHHQKIPLPLPKTVTQIYSLICIKPHASHHIYSTLQIKCNFSIILVFPLVIQSFKS